MTSQLKPSTARNVLLLWLVGWVVLCGDQQASSQTRPTVSRLHAHNDYLHPRPLLDALAAGAGSVEADIFLQDGQLLVAHTAAEIDPQRTLEALYLDPLRERIGQQGGSVFTAPNRREEPLWLLIDIKSDGLATYRRLHEVLESYADILSRVEGDKFIPGAVQVVISGNRPQEFIAAQPKRYCGIDGRLSDLESSEPAHLMPMISDNWQLHFAWRGTGEISDEQRQRVQQIVVQVHQRGRTLRFWATPEEPAIWQTLAEARVDWINTDQLQELGAFLRQRVTQQALKRQTFEVGGAPAFLMAAPQPAFGKPWVWYAPTLGANLPGPGHHWYFERFLEAGISIAGIDLGEVRGSPASNQRFLAFHDEMVRRGYSDRPILLGQSRGGLMTLGFATTYPDKLGGWAGIYPVCNLSSWPLRNSKEATLRDFAMSETELLDCLPQHNPVDKLGGLLAQQVPLFSVHGDQDTVVPLTDNSQLLRERYVAGGGDMQLKIIPGEGHKVSNSFFECQELVDFVLRVAVPTKSAIETHSTNWHGFDKQNFELEGHAAFVVVPRQPAPGNPWIWRTSFPDFHAEVDRELVARGFHIAYINVVAMLGADPALDIMDRFYAIVRRQWHLAAKPAVEPCSRGGLHAYRYAARHPDRVACILGDVPVMDLKSWPLKSGDARGPLQDALKYYGFENVEQLRAYQGNPLDNLRPIAEARIPLRHIVSPNDQVVPPEENSLLAKRKLRELGWDLEVVLVDPTQTINRGHHFPMIEVEQSVAFILKHASVTAP